MIEERQVTGEVHGREVLQRFDQDCGLTTVSNSISDLVLSYIKDKFKGNVVNFSKHAGLHRNFIMDIVVSKKYPKTRDGHRVAINDPRYNLLAKALGLKGDSVVDFVKLVSEYQEATHRKSDRNIGRAGPEIEDSIVQFRADILRTFPEMNPSKLEKAISAHRTRLFDVIARAR